MLKQVSEMTVLKYNYGEHGVFELRRRDSYLVNSESKEITTNWSACYYYHDWDNMMGKFGDLKPGQDVDFNRSVATFFPVQNHEKVEAGLKRFTNEIEELQTLLGACINVLPIAEIKEPLQLATPPPEVKESSPIIDKGKGKADAKEGSTEMGTPKVNGQRGKGKAEEEGWTKVGTPKMSDQKGKGKVVNSTPNTVKKRQDVRTTYGVRAE